MRYALAALAALFLYGAWGHPIESIGAPEAPRGRFSKTIPGTCNPAGFPTTHDAMIRKAWVKHAPIEWQPYHCEFRAQICLESSCRYTNRRSTADAIGLGQQIESAAKDCRVQGGLQGRRQDAEFSLMCAAWLMERNGRIWISPRSELCRRVLARISYVSGGGNGIAGQREARKEGLTAVCWEDGIREGMRKILSPEAFRDVEHYVTRIDELAREMTP